MATSQLLPADVSRSPVLLLAIAGYLPGSRPPRGPTPSPIYAYLGWCADHRLDPVRRVEAAGRALRTVDAGDPPAQALHRLPPHVRRRRLLPNRGHRWPTRTLPSRPRPPPSCRPTDPTLGLTHLIYRCAPQRDRTASRRQRRSSPAATRSSAAPGRPSRRRRVGHVLRAGRPRSVRRGRLRDARAALRCPHVDSFAGLLPLEDQPEPPGRISGRPESGSTRFCRAWAVIQL